MKNKLELLDLTLKTDTEPFLSKDWIKKAVLQLNDKEIRMYLTDEEWFNCIKNIIRKKKIKNLFKL